jgi:hypothetical protein
MVFQQNALIYYLAGHKLIRKGEGGCRFGKVENPSFSFPVSRNTVGLVSGVKLINF